MIVSFVVHLLQLYAADGSASNDSGATIRTSREFKVCRRMNVVYKNASGERVLRINESLLKRYSSLPSYKMAQLTFHTYRKLGKECRKYLEAFVAGGNILEKEINRIAKEKTNLKIAENEEEMKWPEKSWQRYEEIRKRDEQIRLATQARLGELFKIIKKTEEKKKEAERELKLIQEEILRIEEKRKRENDLLLEAESKKIADDTKGKIAEAEIEAAKKLEAESKKIAGLTGKESLGHVVEDTGHKERDESNELKNAQGE